MKKRIIILVLIAFMGAAEVLPAQNIRKERPFGIASTFGGGCLLGVSLNYFVVPQLNIEAGFGLSEYISLKYHFIGDRDINWSPYIGIGYSIPIFGVETNGVMAMPVGVKFIHDKGFSISFEAALCYMEYSVYVNTYSWNSDYTHKSKYSDTMVFPMIGISVGYQF